MRSMNVRANRQPQRAGRRSVATVGDGAIADARRDPDVAQLASAEAEARIADHEVKVALAAYFIAQKRGFAPGHELDDWLAAEAQVAAADEPRLVKPVEAVKVENVS
jgi:hypothetical protein